MEDMYKQIEEVGYLKYLSKASPRFPGMAPLIVTAVLVTGARNLKCQLI